MVVIFNEEQKGWFIGELKPYLISEEPHIREEELGRCVIPLLAKQLNDVSSPSSIKDSN